MRETNARRVGVLPVVVLLAAAPMLRAQQAEHRRIVVELADPPTVVVWAQAMRGPAAASTDRVAHAAAAAINHLARLEAAQQDLLARLSAAAPSATLLFRTQRVMNGIALEVDAGEVPQLAALPGVKAILPLVSYQQELFSSVPLVGAPGVWSSPGGQGNGVRVGIVDTGIDYIHKDFGGSGSYTGQSYADAVVPWTTKVVGGWDFAGDLYDSNCSDADQTAGRCSRTPHPDPDPWDCRGHGTHVAGIIGGYGVTQSGFTFAGPWTSSTDVAGMRIGPGVAPAAQLYALRVFGCTGSTALVAPAMEWAIDPDGNGDFSDHLDVVNLSLGSSFGTADGAGSVAVNNAVQAGVIVVCSAGNSADTYYITGSPGVASKVISVANSVDSTAVVSGVVVNAPPSLAGVKPAAEASFGPDLGSTGPVTANLVLAQSGNPPASDACQPLTNGSAVAGKVALVDRGACTFVVKVKNAQNADAKGVLVADNTDGFVFAMGGSDVTITIPSMFTTQAVGNQLKQAMGSGAVNVTLTAQYRNTIKLVVPSKVDTLSSSSSRGPALGNALKPDLTAPGDTIFSAIAGSGAQGTSLSGTSMASPHVAGAMAILKQLHPTWTVEELKALVINTAAHNLFLSANQVPPVFGPGAVGSGRLDVAAAAASELVAYCTDAPGQVSVSFGAVEVAGTTSATRTVRVVNKDTSPATLALAYISTVDAPGVDISLPDGATLTVPAGGSAAFRVVLTATRAAMKHTRDAAVAGTQGGTSRFWLTEEGGYLRLSAAGRPELRVPVWAAPRPASTMATQESLVAMTGYTGSTALHLTGQGFDTGTSYPTDEVSLVSALELQALSPDDPATQGSANTTDLRYVGVTSDYTAQVALGKGLADTSIFFGVATWGPWSTPNELTLDVLIDTNRDGTDDYRLYNSSQNGSSDVFTEVLCPLPQGSCRTYWLNGVPPSTRDTAPYNSNVMVLQVLPGWLGFTAGASRFNYRVRTDSDTTPILTFDPAHPGVSFGGTDFLGYPVSQPLYKDVPGQTISVQSSRADYAANASKGILLLHHHNTTAMRAQVVAVSLQPRRPSLTLR